MLCWKGIISEITWRETALRQSWCSEQPTELHYKFEKNCRLECQTTVFTCVHSGCLRKSFAKCKRMGQRMSGMYWVSTQIWAKWVAPQRKTVSMKFLHYLTIPLTKPAVISWQCNVKQWPYKRQRALPTRPGKFLGASWTPIHQHEKYYVNQRKITQKWILMALRWKLM